MWKRMQLFVVLAGSVLTVTNVANPGKAAATVQSRSFFTEISTFGSSGSGAGQMQSPQGIAVEPANGNVYVADTGNDRIDVFGPTGTFIEAFAWGVADGQPKAEFCTTSCQAGIPGSGPGQFSRPTTIAIGAPPGPAANKVFVGDAGNNAVETFDADGHFISTIDGTSTPQGHFQNLVGVAMDQNGNLWTADGSTNNVDEFDPHGAFVRQWTDTHGSPSAIAVDSVRDSVYLTAPSQSGCSFFCSGDVTERWTLIGRSEGEIDRPLAYGSEGFGGHRRPPSPLIPAPGISTSITMLDPMSDVRVYDPTGIQVDQFLIGPTTTNSDGIAFASLRGGSAKPGQHDMYVSDATNNDITIYGPQSRPGHRSSPTNRPPRAERPPPCWALGWSPSATTRRASSSTSTTRTSTPPATAQRRPCGARPVTLGPASPMRRRPPALADSRQAPFYHFRVVATNSAGTTTGSTRSSRRAQAPGRRSPGARWTTRPCSPRKVSTSPPEPAPWGSACPRTHARQHLDREPHHDDREHQPAGRARRPGRARGPSR